MDQVLKNNKINFRIENPNKQKKICTKSIITPHDGIIKILNQYLSQINNIGQRNSFIFCCTFLQRSS